MGNSTLAYSVSTKMVPASSNLTDYPYFDPQHSHDLPKQFEDLSVRCRSLWCYHRERDRTGLLLLRAHLSIAVRDSDAAANGPTFSDRHETEYVSEEVTSYRPVLKTRTEEREYKVAKPIVETSFREETYTIRKPVVETSYRDETVTRTSYVTETAEREEQVTSYKPVVETQYYDKQYSVQRPVVETQYYNQQYTMQRPVVETQFQTQQYTSLRPVTTMENQTVDAGGYVAQQVVSPGQVQYGLQQASYYSPGLFGRLRPRSGLFWTPQVTPATVQTQYAYRPNYITQQVAKTAYVPEVQQVQVPVQVQRMQTEVVSQRVPVQVQRMQTEVGDAKSPGSDDSDGRNNRGSQGALLGSAARDGNVNSKGTGSTATLGHRNESAKSARANDSHGLRDA